MRQRGLRANSYACGKWPEEHPIPDFTVVNTWFHERTDRMSRKIRELLQANISASESPWAVMQAKMLFTSCTDVHAMNELDMSPLYDLLTLLDLPLIPALLSNKTGDYIEQMASLKRILGRDIFFGLNVMPDPKNKSRNVIFLDTPDTSSPFPTNKELEKRLRTIRSRLRKLEDIEEESTFTEDEEAEFAYMREIIKLIISNGTIDTCVAEDNSTTNAKELDVLIEDLYDISSTLYLMVGHSRNSSISEENLTDEDYMLVDDLQRITDEYVISSNLSLTPKPIWRPFIESVFKGIIPLDLDKKDKVLVGNLEFLKYAALVFAAGEERELETCVWWVVVDMAVPHSSEKLRKAWTTYVNKVMDIEMAESKSLQCASAVNHLMGMAVSWLFIDPTFHNNKARKVHEMLEDIREAFVSLIGETDWMDLQTKVATLEKSKKMTSEIGYPEWLFDEKKLNEYYEGIDLSETRYLENMVQIVQLTWNNTLHELHKVNLDNETLALNYGAIGSILGHELTHGFDNSGRHYDSDGNVRQWWSNKTITEYTERTQCFVDHYNTYYEDEIDDYIDGELTLGENIADNGGLREAVIAYERWKARHGREPLLPGFTQLTHEQLLFLSYAHLWCESYTTTSLKWMLEDSHCPGHVRLQAVLRNSKEFSAAWKCPVGSNMNPSKKCHLW
ncbi:PREDICTED: neprilysin-11 isoform X1 [Dinoponera quadriceps]|uniref:Neprilysin-11 isoform X1 n=1 Tax=Dinoponera quadriceps TaxID=609295 RepID=A0A6P3WMQ1_DINQU|nr:PREDICTED: neprilysin-11 isoform X1 [Dinoponera quadriceps]XP_014467306.1 PREDICTED: neprilysin-11 isoform X1 [Dinoponera quadriceps]